MLALVLVVGHLILTRLGIAYRAVTGYYYNTDTAGKLLCNDDTDTLDSYQKSRYKSVAQTGYGSPSQATQFTHADPLSYPAMSAQSMNPTKKPTMNTYQSGVTHKQSGYPPTMTTTCPPGMISTMTGGGYPSTMTAAGYPSAMTTGMSTGYSTGMAATGYNSAAYMDLPLDDSCGPEVSPSRTVNGPVPECMETANWRNSRGRCVPASGYMPDAGGTTMASNFYAQDGSAYATATQNKTNVGSAYFDGQTNPPGSAYYGGQSSMGGLAQSSMGGLGYTYGQQSQMSGTRATRQSAAVILQGGGPNHMSQTGGENLQKLNFQFRPSKIPSAYRFPRPDDIPCSNEDFPGQVDQQYNLSGTMGANCASVGATMGGTMGGVMGGTMMGGTMGGAYGSGSRFSYCTGTNPRTPRASPPRSVLSQRPATMYKSTTGPTAFGSTTYGPQETYMEEDLEDVVSLSQGYQAQLGGVSAASAAYQRGETLGVGSMPQAASTIGYGAPQSTMHSTMQSTARPSRATAAYGSSAFQAQASRGSAFATVPPSHSAYSTMMKSGNQPEISAVSRVVGARSATAKDNRPIKAICCGKPTGFDDGPLPRPPKRKSMSTAEDFSKSRAPSRRTGMVGGSSSPSTTPSSTDSPEIEYVSTSISAMPHPPSRPPSPSSPSRQSPPRGASTMSGISRSPTTFRPDMAQSGFSSPQKSQTRQTSGLYSVHASGIRSVSEQDVAPSAAPYSSTPLSRMVTPAPNAMAPPPRKPTRRNTYNEMDCTNTDQFNDV